MKMSGGGAGEVVGVGLAWKLGLFKLLGAGAALLGAFLMAAVFEPKTKREMFLRAAVALGSSLMFTSLLIRVAAPYLGIDLKGIDVEARIDYTLAAGATIGVTSWFALGAIGELLKRFRRDPVGTVQAVRGAGARAPENDVGPDSP
jgi:hypothetical protein